MNVRCTEIIVEKYILYRLALKFYPKLHFISNHGLAYKGNLISSFVHILNR